MFKNVSKQVWANYYIHILQKIMTYYIGNNKTFKNKNISLNVK